MERFQEDIERTEVRQRPARPAILALLVAALTTQVDVRAALAKPPEIHESATVKGLKLEEELEGFLSKAEPLLDTVPDPSMRERLRQVIAYFRNNKKNPERLRLHGDAVPSGDRQTVFWFRFREGFSGSYERTQGDTRFVTLPHDFPSCDDIAFCSVVIHGMVHLMWDDELRAKVRAGTLPFDRYYRYWNTEGNFPVLSAEADAYERQLEFLNFAMGGELRRRVRHNQPIHLKSSNPSLAKQIEDLAIEYFSAPRNWRLRFLKRQFQKIPGVKFYDEELRME